MKKFFRSKFLLVSIMFLALLCLILPLLAWANTNTDTFGLQPVGQASGLGTQDLRVTIARVIRIVLGLLGVVAVAIIIYGGYLYMTASGVAEKVDKAKKLLLQATIGLLIIVSAFAITQFILGQLLIATGTGGSGGGPGPENPPGPNPIDVKCTNPSDNADPWLCVEPNSGQKDGLITIYGGNIGDTPGRIYFTDKDKSVEYDAEIVTCLDTEAKWFKNISGSTLKKVKVKVPDLVLGLGGNKYYVVAEIGSVRTINKLWQGYVEDDRKDRFSLTNESNSLKPEIICFQDDNNQEIFEAVLDQNIKIKGLKFGATKESLKFDQVAAADAETTWQDELITTKVPKTASGYVQVKVTHLAEPNTAQDWLNITCTDNAGCAYCCKQRQGAKLCLVQEDCLGAEGEDCNDGATCNSASSGCQANLFCDPTADCTCKSRGLGAKCSSDPNACTPDSALCGQGLYCGGDCTCKAEPIITKVDADNGKAGNFITIIGQGFGNPVVDTVPLFADNFEQNSAGAVPSDWRVNTRKFSKVIISDKEAASGSKSLHIYRDADLKYPGICTKDLCDNPSKYVNADQCTWNEIARTCNFPTGKTFNENTAFTAASTTDHWVNDGMLIGAVHDLKALTFENEQRYLLRFKIKGKLTGNTNLRISILPNYDWPTETWNKATYSDPDCTKFCPSGYNCQCSDANVSNYLCCRQAPVQLRPYYQINLSPIAIGVDYDVWTEYESMFTYFSDQMGSWLDNQSQPERQLAFMMANSNTLEGTDIYIDDLEIVKLPAMGEVYFCNSDGCGDENENDALARMPFEISSNCLLSSCWTDTQIVVEVPDWGDSGPIKLITPDKLEETTADSDGWVGNFEINDIARPAICRINPLSQEVGKMVRVLGQSFGETAGEVKIGGINFDKKPFWYWNSWADIVRATMPNLQPGKYPVQVKAGSEYSNTMEVMVLAAKDIPIISYIDPVSGPSGQYITIFGQKFGKEKGQVLFKKSDYSYVAADVDFPSQCAGSYWKDSAIIVKVPSNLGTFTTYNVSNIKVRTNSGLESLPFNFQYCTTASSTCPLRPGICLLSPNQGPAGTAVTVYGDNFKTYNSSNSKVIFYDNQNASGLNSDNWQQVTSGKNKYWSAGSVSVPVAAKTGPLYLTDSDLNKSNSLNFIAADCRTDNAICDSANTGNICCERDGVCKSESACYGSGPQMCVYAWGFTTGDVPLQNPPQVIEDIECVEDIQSPSPWQNSSSNCLNANISARFNQKINIATLDINNIIVKQCNQGANFDSVFCQIAPWHNASRQIIAINENAGFIYLPPAENGLVANTWYEVTLVGGSQGIRGDEIVGGFGLDGDFDKKEGGDYVWHFKVQDSQEKCQLNKVIVTPSQAKIELITEVKEYNAFALAANCNILNGDVYNWDWYKLYSDGVQEDGPVTTLTNCDRQHCLANIPESDLNNDGNTDWQQLVTPKKQGKIWIGAQAVNKKDDNNVLEIDLNIPEITRIYPDNGLVQKDVDSYVTIYGSNFGVNQDDSKVLFDDALAQLAPQCTGAWSDNQIQVLVPKAGPIMSENTVVNKSPVTTLQNGMVLYYDGDGTSNVTLDDKAGNYNGEMFGTKRVQSDFASALNFSGYCNLETKKCLNSDQSCDADSFCQNYVKLPNTLNLGQGSLAMWFKPLNYKLATDQTLFSISDGTANNVLAFKLIYTQADNAKLALELKANSVNSSIITKPLAASKDRWHYLVYTYDDSKISLYIDGIKYFAQLNAADYLGSNIGATNSSSIGFFGDLSATSEVKNTLLGAVDANGLMDFYSGLIDGFAVYDKVLSEVEVADNYGIGQGQILLLDFEETDNDVKDSSANNFNNFRIIQPGNVRRGEGIYGQAMSGSPIYVADYPALKLDREFTIQGWFKVDKNNAPDYTIFEQGDTKVGQFNCGNAGTVGFCFQANIIFESKPAANRLYYVNIPTTSASYKNNEWNYFAAVFDGKALRLHLNEEVKEFVIPNVADRGRIINNPVLSDDYHSAYLLGVASSYGAYDNLALYNTALSKEQINSRVGAKNGSHVIVDTAFGQADSWTDAGQVFNYSDYAYPFLCQLNPNQGLGNTKVAILGNNFGDYNQTTYQNTQFEVPSYINFDIDSLLESSVKGWSNTLLNIINPYNEYPKAEIPVTVSIDPQAEPFIDADNSNTYSPGEQFADIFEPKSIYNVGDYLVEKFYPDQLSRKGEYDLQATLQSNPATFYLSPVITSLTPDKGPLGQWVTIFGYNFGEYVEGESQVIFNNNQVATFPPAPCKNYWTNTQIIVVVPDGATSGNLYLRTGKALTSNSKKFTVNNDPLGPGLCEISPSLGGIGRTVVVKGDRFDQDGNGRGDDNIIFSDNKIASTPIWTNRNITTQVPEGAVDGNVVVTRRTLTSTKCVGFSIGSWCPSNNYENVYVDAPSNPVKFDVYLPCEKGGAALIRTDEAITPGFPLSPENNTQIDTGIMATDGTYLYTKTYYEAKVGDDYYKIYKIGTGYNGTELGKIYKTYNLDPAAVSTWGVWAKFTCLTYHSNGVLYSCQQAKISGQPNILKIVLNDTNSTYTLAGEKISEGLMASWDDSYVGCSSAGCPTSAISSNGFYIFTIATIPPWNNPGGYHVKYYNPADNWKLMGDFIVKNDDYNKAQMLPRGLIVNDNVIYPLQYYANGSKINAINWQEAKWLTNWQLHDSKELGGQYDWTNSVIWTGEYFGSKIYQYADCPLSGQGFCTSDADCQRCGVGVSTCKNGRCTPVIKTITPDNGPAGRWIDVYGCYFCDPLYAAAGTIKFTDNKKGLIVNDQECKGYWTCDQTATEEMLCDSNGNNCDNVFVEVPNKFTPTQSDDAVSGPLTLITAKGLSTVSKNNFTVNNDVIGQQICALHPTYGNRGITVRIHGENFGENGGAVAQGDYIFFGPSATSQIKEPWQDSQTVNNIYDNGESYTDFNSNKAYDNTLEISPYQFNISQYVNDAAKCPQDGWAERDICFKVPSTAGGEGTGNMTALNDVKVYKNNSDNDTQELFSVTYGLCGNMIIDGTEQCDGINFRSDITCKNQGYANESDCTLECNSSCKASVCDKLSGVCTNIEEPGECGNNISEVGEECDGTDLNDATCTSLNHGTGTLACDSNCYYDYGQCSINIVPTTGRPKVESVVPPHGVNNFCRNGMVDVYFDSALNLNTVDAASVKLQICTGSQTVTLEQKKIGSKIAAFLGNLFNKLLGRQREAVAANLGCDNYTDYSDFDLKVRNIYGKTMVSVVPKGLLEPAKIYRVRLSKELTGVNGAKLDNIGTSINDGTGDYVTDLMTLGQIGDDKSGICNVEWINVNVYRQAFEGENPPLLERESEIRADDLFMCAKDSCLLNTDYDQDKQNKGNQHIYEAIAKYSGGYSLKANIKWTRTDSFDPKKAITIYNNTDDNDVNANIIQNSTGVIYLTAANIKEALAKLIIEAQAEGSWESAVQQEFLIYILLCENPWPSINEKFPISNIINAYNFQLYYCRDAGNVGDTSDDLPAARWLFPEVSNLSTLDNTDFERGSRTSTWWSTEGTCFLPQPVYSDITAQRDGIPSNLQGKWWASSQENYQGNYWQDIYSEGQGLSSVGVMNSQGFLVEGNQLKFLIGGSNNDWSMASAPYITSLTDTNINGVTTVVLAINDDPTSQNWKVVATATGNDSPQMSQVTFDTSAYMSKRACTSNDQCNGYGQCQCEGVCSAQNVGKCSPVTGIIYIYDNNTGGYVSFDYLRQFKDNVEIPIRF